MTDRLPACHCGNESRMPPADQAARVTQLGGSSQPDGLSCGPSHPDFAAIYAAYFEFVWSCTRRMGIRESEMDDVVQDVFIVIHGKLSTLEKPESLRSWIYGIIRRTASSHHRSRRTTLYSDAEYDTSSSVAYPQSPTPLELAVQSDQTRLLWTLLDKLEPAKREVLVLSELDEMTAPEIAAAIEIPLNTVYSRLRSARQDLDLALSRFQAQSAQRGRK